MTSDVQVVLRDSPLYPALLASIPDPPKALYLRGTLSAVGGVAMVGSRRPTPYGRRMARRLGGEAGRRGVATVSGLARGIDTEVHKATLEAGGTTWAVLGSGLDRLYPSENAALAEEIVGRGGAVLTEFPPGTPPLPENFPRRNRIVSGLSWGTVVVEGTAVSGALITARCALEQGREVFAVPGPADSPLSDGPHELLRQGARLTRGIEDVLEELPMLEIPPALGAVPSAPRTCGTDNDLPHDAQKILELLGGDSVPFDSLMEETGWDAARLLGTLTALEMDGRLRRLDGSRYARD